ncbi:MAG: hypothetical protein ACRBCJ_11175 [Hyphomicrobiaceae bacterium]
MKPKYILDKNGKVMPAEKFLKREAKDWFGSITQALRECGDTGKKFAKECSQIPGEIANDFGNKKKKKK